MGPEPQAVEDRYDPDPPGYRVEAWVENLVIPWELVFLPDNRALVTERPGRIRLIENGNLRNRPYLDLVGEAVHAGEGGLMGMALHPEYQETVRNGGRKKSSVSLRKMITAVCMGEFEMSWQDRTTPSTC